MVTQISLCDMTKGPNTSRVSLNVDGSSLLYHGETDVKMTTYRECKPISFSKGFLENDSELAFEGKICLAVVLSFSFLDFCGKPWFPGGWKKDNLYLMQTGHNLSLQPFLVTDIKSEKRGPSVVATIEIWDTKLLDHGILLMEIFQQECFQEPLKQSGKGQTRKEEERES